MVPVGETRELAVAVHTHRLPAGSYSGAVRPPILSVTPEGFQVTLPEGQGGMETLNIRNLEGDCNPWICSIPFRPDKTGAFAVLAGKKALLLDMNSTFMFGEDRFGETEDFSLRYSNLGGTLARKEINRIIRAAYNYLDIRYPDERYRHNFPPLESAILEVAGSNLKSDEMEKIIKTFAFHELGHIPPEYAAALHDLRRRFDLAAVIDIWSPKLSWLETFEHAGIAGLFSALSFSSDHGMVKPSPRPFELVLGELGISNDQAVVIGDSPRRDLGGAKGAGIDCILVGGARHTDALASFGSLIELCHVI